MAEKMDEQRLKAIVSRELSLATTDAAARQGDNDRALEYYRGEMADLPAEEGRSSVVSKDTADVLNWLMPQIMRVFTASDQIALCEPVGEEDAPYAKQATAGLNYVFLKENDGYRTLYNACWDSLLVGNGMVKVWWDDSPVEVPSYHQNLTLEQLTMLTEEPEPSKADTDGNGENDDDQNDTDTVEVLAKTEKVGIDPMTGMPITLYDVKIKRTDRGGRVVVESIPPEDYGKDADSKTCKDARFQYHRNSVTRSDLIEMGFDKDDVHRIGIATASDGSKASRDDFSSNDAADTSTEVVDFYEIFMRVDVDGDGVAEMCRVYWGGSGASGNLLDWDVWEDEAPFHDIPCKPLPHRWEASSIFDDVEDVQRIKTVMLRQANDNTYATNNPQRFAKGNILNPEELFNPSFGGVVRGDENAEIIPLTIPFVANHAYDALNYQDQVIQRRTGVGRNTMALDPEALQNQSATANQNEKDASYSQVEQLARNMAEFGWANVFKAILRLMVKHPDLKKTIRLHNKPVQIDPQWWNTDMDVTINVGLGTGSRDRDARSLMGILMQQKEELQLSLKLGLMEEAIALLPFIRNTQQKFCEAVGLKNPEAYFPEVDPEPLLAKAAEKAKQPPPEMMLEQMKAKTTLQIEQGKNQLKAQSDKMQSDVQVRREQAQLEADMMTKDADRQNSIVLEQQRQQFEREKLQAQMQLEFAKLSQARELELLKLDAQEMDTGEVGPDGAPKKSVKGKADTRHEALMQTLMQGMAALMQEQQRIEALQTAPVELIRDPTTGKAVGARKVMN